MESPTGNPVDPEELHAIARIKDGSRIVLRAIRPDDEELMLSLFNTFSSQIKKRRWFHAKTYIPRREPRTYLDNDYRRGHPGERGHAPSL